MTLSEAASSDVFFFHDSMDVSKQIEADLLTGLVQSKRSLFYNRNYGCDIPAMENKPVSMIQQVLGAFGAINLIGLRNMRVSNGTNGNPDRRVASSQDKVTVETVGSEINISVGYVELRDLSQMRETSTPIGGVQ
jgi:hypothetical protein